MLKNLTICIFANSSPPFHATFANFGKKTLFFVGGGQYSVVKNTYFLTFSEISAKKKVFLTYSQGIKIYILRIGRGEEFGNFAENFYLSFKLCSLQRWYLINKQVDNPQPGKIAKCEKFCTDLILRFYDLRNIFRLSTRDWTKKKVDCAQKQGSSMFLA